MNLIMKKISSLFIFFNLSVFSGTLLFSCQNYGSNLNSEEEPSPQPMPIQEWENIKTTQQWGANPILYDQGKKVFFVQPDNSLSGFNKAQVISLKDNYKITPLLDQNNHHFSLLSYYYFTSVNYAISRENQCLYFFNDAWNLCCYQMNTREIKTILVCGDQTVNNTFLGHDVQGADGQNYSPKQVYINLTEQGYPYYSLALSPNAQSLYLSIVTANAVAINEAVFKIDLSHPNHDVSLVSYLKQTHQSTHPDFLFISLDGKYLALRSYSQSTGTGDLRSGEVYSVFPSDGQEQEIQEKPGDFIGFDPQDSQVYYATKAGWQNIYRYDLQGETLVAQGIYQLLTTESSEKKQVLLYDWVTHRAQIWNLEPLQPEWLTPNIDLQLKSDYEPMNYTIMPAQYNWCGSSMLIMNNQGIDTQSPTVHLYQHQ